MGAVKEARLGRMDGHPETQERQQQSCSISTFHKGHRPTDSGVSCVTTVSMVSEDRFGLDEEGEEEQEKKDEREEEEVILNPSLSGSVRLDMPSPLCTCRNEKEEQGLVNRIPGEPFKTFLSGLFLAAGFIATTTSLAFTHERVPETEPLPDLLLDHVKHQEWGLDVSEDNNRPKDLAHPWSALLLPRYHHVRHRPAQVQHELHLHAEDSRKRDVCSDVCQ